MAIGAAVSLIPPPPPSLNQKDYHSQMQACTLVDLTHVVSLRHIQHACFKAMISTSRGQMKTRQSLAAEILYTLAGTGKITDAMRYVIYMWPPPLYAV
jgi:tRNA threonylcarbamoyladenosine modification (KEOPS) complex Cgi121 subunit